jgi:hypothetical protein
MMFRSCRRSRLESRPLAPAVFALRRVHVKSEKPHCHRSHRNSCRDGLTELHGCQANNQFRCSQRHQIRHHAVDSDRRQEHRDRRERSGKRGIESPGSERIRKPLFHRLRVKQRLIAVNGYDQFLQWKGKRERIARCPNEKIRPPKGRAPLLLKLVPRRAEARRQPERQAPQPTDARCCPSGTP